MRKLKLLFEFYKSTFIFVLGFSIIAYNTPVINSLHVAFLYGSFIGLFMIFMLKELKKESDYLYYFNCGLTKIHLYGFNFLLNLLISFLLLILFK